MFQFAKNFFWREPMSTRRFAELAARLYPFTHPDPKSVDTAIRGEELVVSPASYTHPEFAGLETSAQGQLQVVITRQFTQRPYKMFYFGGETFEQPHASSHVCGTVRHTLPVRAFVKLARWRALEAELFKDIDGDLRAKGEVGLVNLNTVAPAYRDGLLALAKELQDRKDTRARANQARSESVWPHIEI
jgi:hypothetical protein